ncbi:MAG TPA: hypothetical protein VIF12_05605 [Micavibrio sp.]|jgi:hypothetical protein
MRQNESGNVMFYILIAIVLLAALSYAISQGGRTSAQNLTGDRERLLATEIVDYADTVKKAVQMLRLRGSQFSDLSFASDDLAGYGVPDTAPVHEIFNTAGGAVIYKAPDNAALALPSDWIFTATNEVENIGTTSGAADNADLLMILQPLTKNVCVSLNDRLGVTNPAGDPPADADVDTTVPFTGSPGFAQTIGNEAGSAALAGHNAGCFRETASGNYYFYQVLLAR